MRIMLFLLALAPLLVFSHEDIRKKEVDWEQEYMKKEIWEKKPHEYTKIASQYIQSGKVCDIGCGEGFDCVYLAALGYDVVGIDISETALKRMVDNAEQAHVHVQPYHADISSLVMKDSYDLVLSYGTLQFLGERFYSFLQELKDRTPVPGVHGFYIRPLA